jgi:hypothetical protein
MTQYITGLLLDGERKSIEPLAARLVDRSDQIQAMRQRLQQCVIVSPWVPARCSIGSQAWSNANCRR